jgi:redox-sensitive bicupin YhaK (pirin superfamily)
MEPMVTVRRSDERGRSQHGWLDSRHTFSFADYQDPQHMGFRQLRVINEDRVQPGRGFPTHAHRDMEIVSYVLQGALQHQDSLGNGSIIRPGDVQRMSAGTGVTHSEYNPSSTEPVHFLQIWILPERQGLPPGYEQRTFPAAERDGRLRLVASRTGREGSVTVHQDVDLFAAVLAAGAPLVHRLAAGRHAWVQVARGAIAVNGTALGQGDGAALGAEAAVELHATRPAEVLLFDLA